MKLSNYISRLAILFLLSSVCFLSCKDDDQSGGEGSGSILPFNSTEHIYGTIQVDNSGEWELAIAPSTGQVDTIPGTWRPNSGLSLPIGTTFLTSYDRNQRISISASSRTELALQDLGTFDQTIIELTDLDIDETVSNPQFIRFGKSEDEIYLLDSDDSLWKIDLLNETVKKTDINIPTESGTYISNMFYLQENDHILIVTNEQAINAGTGTDMFILDPIDGAVVDEINFDNSFGFVQHPSENNTIYQIQLPVDDKGFRLMRTQVFGEQVNVNQVSPTDLAIDNLSPYIQTIHTGTNSYICRGGSASIEMPQPNTLYSIDLTSGNLSDEVELELNGTLIKLAGQ